jgi:hypothetical protein
MNFHGDLLSEAAEYLLSKKNESEYEVKIALKAIAKAQYSCQTWWASTKDHFSKEIIQRGFLAQKSALAQALMAISSESDHVILKGVSDKLEKRLDRYLSRIR